MEQAPFGELTVAHAHADFAEPLPLPSTSEALVLRARLPDTGGRNGLALVLAWLECEPGTEAYAVELRVRRNQAPDGGGWPSLRVTAAGQLYAESQRNAVLCADQVRAGAAVEYVLTARRLGAQGECRILAAHASVGFVAAPAAAAPDQATAASGKEAPDPDWEREPA